VKAMTATMAGHHSDDHRAKKKTTEPEEEEPGNILSGTRTRSPNAALT